MYDIGIVGGGTAGLTAAIYGQRAGKKTIVFEGTAYGGQISSSARVENYPGIAVISGFEFSMNLSEQAKSLEAELVSAQVQEIRKEGENFLVTTSRGDYICKTVILATGMTHRHLGLEKEKHLTGSGVSYCATCDGAFFRGRDVAVIGGGNTALQDALFLSAYCSKVYLVHRRDEFRGEDRLVEQLRKKENVEFIMSAVVKDISGKFMVDGVILNNKKTGEDFTIPVSGIFVAVGQIPGNENFADIVELDENGFIRAGEDCVTSCPGIFAAGDCRTKEIRQLVTAAADGAAAALAACKYIRM
ncbi:MAG: thioredoxin-disulfide reductase [Lachnospiraceae bacterium]|nr:thioredoxin-disulfide reductase [Lachnospiraceae bacterium]